jgi:hypothetical protein
MKARLSTAILATLILTLVFGVTSVLAAEDEGPTTFFISAFHNVKGDEIGLTREAPVRISVVKDEQIIAQIYMEYRQRVDAYLPGGDYEFIFNDADTGDTLFTCGPYKIDNGEDVRMQVHEQGPGRNPDCYVRFK